MSSDEPQIAPQIAVVVPIKNEEDNIAPLVREIVTALTGKIPFEIVYVDDGSDDGSLQALQDARADFAPMLRIVRHRQSCGQSIAVHSGVKAARAPLIATLDGDGQNDPADLPRLLERYGDRLPHEKLMVCGERAKRNDSAVRLLSSRIANGVRRRLLKDGTPDSGCGLKMFRREDFLAFPRFNHMHRYLPALIQRDGGTAVSVPVNHRARELGTSKYGISNRLFVGIVDMFAVRWLLKRGVVPELIDEDA
ncbi:MAG: glycosyltransferase family 2 protein [Alphaproteobacteria bacterium]